MHRVSFYEELFNGYVDVLRYFVLRFQTGTTTFSCFKIAVGINYKK